MATYPFFIKLAATLGANGTGTLSYQVSTNEKITVKNLRQVSTGGFDITGIRDSGGRNYSNASAANPIDGNMIQDIASPNIGLQTLITPLELEGGFSIYFDVVDTSGAGNTVELMLECIRDTK